MPAVEKPVVLMVDDDADATAAALHQWPGRVNLLPRDPQEVTADDIRRAHLITVDYRIGSWRARNPVDCVSRDPLNGVALAAVLKGHAQGSANSPAFVLRSAHLDDLSDGEPPEGRLHIIARQLNLEWVQTKAGDAQAQLTQICSLAHAIMALPERWPNDDADATRRVISEWLSIPPGRWFDLAWQSVESCHPPFLEITSRQNGLSLIRWLLHRILPYPCFLWTSGKLAVRLRVTLDSLNHSLATGLGNVFLPAEYKGQLSDFLGVRWWGSGCESILWELTGGNSFDTQSTMSKLNALCTSKLSPSPHQQPVLTVDEHLSQSDSAVDITSAVRVQPDDWPPYAETGWASLILANDRPKVRSSVVIDDRDRLGTTDEQAGDGS